MFLKIWSPVIEKKLQKRKRTNIGEGEENKNVWGKGKKKML